MVVWAPPVGLPIVTVVKKRVLVEPCGAGEPARPRSSAAPDGLIWSAPGGLRHSAPDVLCGDWGSRALVTALCRRAPGGTASHRILELQLELLLVIVPRLR